jgi:putative pyruvate formate lyase activating enzyme
MEEQLRKLKQILKHCTLCPRRCGVDRTAGERGFCGLADRPVVARALPHHGEEPPISGERGAGTIFLASCNLRCRFCQNHQISHAATGREEKAAGLMETMLRLQEAGCHNIEPVTPTPHAAALLEAWLLARRNGLTVPLVYNCGGYEPPEVLRLLEGMVDVYLPDFKFGDPALGFLLAGVPDYPGRAVAAIAEMIRQVGDDLETEGSLAIRGVIVRHLVLPGRADNSRTVLDLIRDGLGGALPLSLLAQYTPVDPVRGDPLLGRRVTAEEYESVVEYALDLGFEELYVQSVDEREIVPDFRQDDPFRWPGTGG